MAKKPRKDTSRQQPSAEQSPPPPPEDKGLPGGGQGRVDETGFTNVYPMSSEKRPSGDTTIQPMGSFGQGERGAEGYEDSGTSEIIPPERFQQQAHDLSGLRVAAIVTDGFEEVELTEPMRALQEAQARVEIISPQRNFVQAVRNMDKGATLGVDRQLSAVRPEDYDALLLPGGAMNADALRVMPEAQAFARHFQESGKPIAVICHGPWLLVSANLVRGRRLTSYHTIQDDIRNAGGEWLDQEVVEDGNWVSSRQPDDLPAFNAAMLRLFAHAPAAH